MSSEAALAPRSRWAGLSDPFALIACAAMALGLVLRMARPNLPLWLDETWTAAIATQSSFGDVLRHSLLDANAPLYFTVVHLWTAAFGISNGSLRFPSLIFGTLMPLLALIPVKSIPRETRLLWCALLALWIPGIGYSAEARGYTMLLFLVMASTIAFVRLLEQPDRTRAWVWASIGALAVLTHYHALIILGCQGLGYLAWHRGRAVRTWPAVLAFVPAFIWALVHFPHVAKYADPRFSWFDRLTLDDVPGIVFFSFGDMPVVLGLMGPALIPLLARRSAEAPAADTAASPLPWVAVATSALALTVVLSGAALSNSFTVRYMVPFAPALLLALSLLAVRYGRSFPIIPVAVALVFAVTAAKWTVEGRGRSLKVYNFQAASDALMAANVRRLAIFWDNPLHGIVDREQFKDIGSFFFRRASHEVTMVPVALEAGEDPNRLLIEAAGKDPHAGLLWLYDLDVRGTVAKSFPLAIETLDPAWKCRQFGRDAVGVVACTRKPG